MTITTRPKLPVTATPAAARPDVTVARDGENITITARTLVADGPYQRAHFPGLPVLPGVFLLEIVRQAVAECFSADWEQPADIREVNSVRFLAPAGLGDTVTAEITVTALTGQAASVRARFQARGRLTATLSATIGTSADRREP
jgi:3-hydroxymyristoyl/3-hydroxydecanoyl-(acyl carrier protein) dehydratase